MIVLWLQAASVEVGALLYHHRLRDGHWGHRTHWWVIWVSSGLLLLKPSLIKAAQIFVWLGAASAVAVTLQWNPGVTLDFTCEFVAQLAPSLWRGFCSLNCMTSDSLCCLKHLGWSALRSKLSHCRCCNMKFIWSNNFTLWASQSRVAFFPRKCDSSVCTGYSCQRSIWTGSYSLLLAGRWCYSAEKAFADLSPVMQSRSFIMAVSPGCWIRWHRESNETW